jgi:hypothetical protein
MSRLRATVTTTFRGRSGVGQNSCLSSVLAKPRLSVCRSVATVPAHKPDMQECLSYTKRNLAVAFCDAPG